MLMDEIFENMVDTLKDAKQIAKTASPLPLSMAQFELLDNTNGDIDVSLSKTHFKRNVVATGYDSQDKAILKEKGRAIEVGDITEQAHPETVVVAENYKGSGEVENQNEQHAKIVDSINRMPTGFNFNTFAFAIKELVKIAEKLDREGDLRASARVMQGVVRLSNLKKKELNKSAADPTPEEVEGWWRQKAIESGNLAGDAAENQSTAPPSVAPSAPVKPKSVPPPVNYGDPKLLGSGKPAPAPINFGNPKLLGPGAAPRALTPDEIIDNNRPHQRRPLPGGATTIDVDVTPNKYKQLGSKPNVGKGGGIISSLLRSLKGRGGRLGLIAAALVGAGTLIGILSNSQDDVAAPAESLANSENTELVDASNEFQQSFSQAVADAGNGEAESALEALAACEGKVNQMAALASTPEDQAHVESLNKTISLMGSRLNAEVQSAAADTGQTVSAERGRVRGLQEFFKEHYDPAMPITGVPNARLQSAIHKFVHNVKEDLGVAPKLFTVENLLSYGTGERMEQIRDIWERPHLHVDKTLLEQ